MGATKSGNGRRLAARRIAGDGRGGGRLRDAIDGLTAFVGVLTPDGTLVEANSAALRAAGLRHEDVIGRPFDETYWWSFSPESRSRLRGAVERARCGESSRFDATNRVADGRLITVDFTLAPVCDPAGRVSHLIASGIDITERKRAEEALRRSEERFAKAFKASPDVLVISRVSDGTILEVNESWSELFGYRSEEVLGKSSLALNLFVNPEDRLRALAALREQGSARDFEVRVRTKSGEVRHALLSIETMEIGGEPCILTIVRDVTERRRADQRIRQQAAMLDVAQDAIVVRDMEDRIRYWNKGAERLYGWTAREAAGRDVAELLYREPTPQFREAQAVLAERGEWRGELHQVTKEGRDIIVEGRWTLVRDEAGVPHSKLVVNTDITERKRLEAELLRATQFSLVGELAASLAHEIKNPLAGLKGAVDILIQRHGGGGLVAEVLEDMRHAVDRVDETVRALLRRARPHTLRLEPAPLAEAAHRAVQLARHHAEGRGVSVVFEPPPAPVVAPIDAAQIECAVFNLVINGVEAIEGGGRVAVRVRLAGANGDGPAEAVVEVEDDGCGIAEDNLAKVFQPFHTTTNGGTGLGLPAVRRVALAHGGRVEVRSAPGRGSTFSLHLPLTDHR